MRSFNRIFPALAFALASSSALAGVDDAKLFGARPWASDAELSPDAKHLVFIAPVEGASNAAVIENLADGSTKIVLSGNSKLLMLANCAWSSNSRIVCQISGTAKNKAFGQALSLYRNVAVDLDGSNRRVMAGGDVIDWLDGSSDTVLMARPFGRTGLGVERVNTRTDRGDWPEPQHSTAVGYVTDGNGVVRIVAEMQAVIANIPTRVVQYRYRRAAGGELLPFSRVDGQGPGLRPIAVDADKNVAYALDNSSGRDALYRVALDGSMRTELVYADPVVDVGGTVSIGRHGRIIGLTYVSDRRQVIYFDPEYRTLAQNISKALPKTPLIHFASASADERKLLLFATGDTDPGHFYLLDRDTKKMTEVLQARPGLVGRALSTMKSISYPAADGTTIMAYLTLPPTGGSKNLPAIVMPHGGPTARDEWGFDWLAQYFASKGFAVLQPQYRGSAGYGTDFLNGNGFKSWRRAIGDILDAGRWLDRQGIADPAKLAIVGWSYGGYAALQSNVVDPDLFKAIVAIAPVTDLGLFREQHRIYTDFYLESREIGTGPEAVAGSPARHAEAIKAPVLMFHGDTDLNVDVGESRAMDAALKRAGKDSTLIVYPGLDHQLPDNDARADMLGKADVFLQTQLRIVRP